MTYPHTPGTKARETSATAAAQMIPKAPTLREKCLDAITYASEGLTADEVASAIGKSILAVRPRITELDAVGLIESTPERRRNVSGKYAIVWKLKAKHKQVGLF